MNRLVFFLEEPSAAEMLKGLLPRILPADVVFDFKIFEGKQDLEKRLPRVLTAWRTPQCRFIVIRDQDSGDCRLIKNKITQLCHQAKQHKFLVRIACRELESFYLGDLAAVEQGLGINGLARKQNNEKYRFPDNLGNPANELRKLTSDNYQKVSGSRVIAPLLNVANNRSHSFQVLIAGINKILES